MAALRKGKCYKNLVRAYTRKSKVRGKDFIKAVPTSKVVTYRMGDAKGTYDFELHLVADSPHQIRHNALESSRLIINRRLNISVGPKNFFFQVLPYPHHVLRENKMLSGAGADRMQTGMSHAFGRAVGLAAQVKSGRKIFLLRVKKDHLTVAKQILHLARPRLPGKYKVQVQPVTA